MKVTLAGATLDRRFWKDDPSATPETISAAYARISHSPRTIGELRELSSREVEKARRSNENIVYRMGHSSIAEHAVFNIDIEDASRLLVEFLEHHRLASFTERSQRYVFFGDKTFIIPDEVKGTPFKRKAEDLEGRKFDLYNKLVNDRSLREEYGDKLLEQARYVLGLTCPTDIGFTVNARELEYIIAQGASHELSEVRELSKALLKATASLAPSLIKYTEGNDHVRRTTASIRDWIQDNAEDILSEESSSYHTHVSGQEDICCERPTSLDDPESEIAASLIFENSDMTFKECRCLAREMTDDQLIDLFTPIFRNYPVHSSLPRAFEMMDLTFDFKISASAFAQLKRHRMSTLMVQDYDPDSWFTPAVFLEDPDDTREYLQLMRESSDLFKSIKEGSGADVGAYFLTNAHEREVVFKTNLRELYHFVRLRSDAHAQEEIRSISDRIVRTMKEHFPVVTALLCGKDSHSGESQRIMGCSGSDGDD